MAEYTVEDLAGFRAQLQNLTDAFALALSESLNQLVTIDPPALTVEDAEAVLQNREIVLQTTFALPALGPDECAMAFSQRDACAIADLIAGGTGVDAPHDLEDEHMNRLADAMAGIVQRFGIAIGNALGADPQVTGVSTAMSLPSLPPAVALDGRVIVAALPFHIADVVDSVFRLFFTTGMARAYVAAASPSGPQEAAATPVPEPAVEAAHFSAFDQSPLGDTLPRGVDRIMDIPLEVTCELGRVRMLIRDVLELETGSIVELDHAAGEPIDLLVNGRLVAHGEVVVIDDNFGVRVTQIVSPADRIASLGRK
ncbi:MAG TPA: flagellar motor switch protein FliN [Chthonomonadales bacterium]|nr:flagellar motor switch protein FliN [Chthonomonadales bacterium]